ncbi:MAG: phosphate/phosphite/phosphonate ABC transporter substrate-binding protein [Anaerolineales bacterium]
MKQVALLLLLAFLSACASGPKAAAFVSLNELQPLPTATPSPLPLRVAMASVISPQGTVESYALLLDYLAQKLNRPVELVQRRTYLEVNDLIKHGEVDLAFVCTSAYIVGHDDFGMELLVAPQVNGQTVYQAYLIVPASSVARDVADLRGKVFAFTDPISLTGRAYPTWLIQSLGSTPETFFGRTFFTYSHDKAIYAVANGLADGASVDSLVYDFALARDPSLATRVKVIHRSPPFGIPPVVVNPGLRPQVKAELRDLLLNMHRDPQGQVALAAIGVERFVTIGSEAYRSVRAIMDAISLPPLP